MYSIYRVYTVDIVYTLQVSTSTNGIVIHSTRWDCQSPNPRKYIVLMGILCLICMTVFINVTKA